MKILIAILSCESYRTNGNNQALRDTWLPALKGADYKFFMGKGSTATQSDEVLVDAPDDYANVTYKTREIYKWALEHDYDFIFKCFPDTYVCPSRLLNSGFENYDYVGNFACRPQGSFAYCTGGTGYWVSKKAYKHLATAHIPPEDTFVIPTTTRKAVRPLRAPSRCSSGSGSANSPIVIKNDLKWAEDKWTGGLLYTHEDLKVNHDLRYEENVYGPGPQQNNNTISIHLSRTEYSEGQPSRYESAWMHDKHNAWLQGVVVPVKGIHNEDIREFYDWEHEMFNSKSGTNEIKKVAVITPTVDSRAVLLEECKASVKAQTWKGEIFHAISVDVSKEGAAVTRNKIVQGLDPSYEWVAFVDDDDLLMPEHIATLVSHSDGADVVYSDCQANGFVKTWNTREFTYAEVKEANYIPVTVLMRRSMFEKVGGFDLTHYPGEDQWMFLNAALVGARFQYVPKITWTYRQHPQYRLQTSPSS